ncbi:MAG: hypothetical protein LBM70_04000 [Victivallales bacterium]|jgi:hypothetical protein|nr:hypothetical protein [Victivallales bacterium]
MKRKIAFMFALMGVAVLFAGCSSVQTADSSKFNGQKITVLGDGVAHISGYSSGLYFLWIPLFVGSAENPDTIAFGEDSCNVNAVTKMVTAKAKEMNASATVDLVSIANSVTLPVPIPFLFSWKTVTVSGNAVK